MSTITLAIVIVFVFGYLCIALETVTKVNKAAVALLMLVATWTLYMFDPGNFVGCGRFRHRRTPGQYCHYPVLSDGRDDYCRDGGPVRWF